MSNSELEEAPIIRGGFTQRWGRTTTTTPEVADPVSTTSEDAYHAVYSAGFADFFIAGIAHTSVGAVPVSVGNLRLVAGTPEQIGFLADVIGSSGVVTHHPDPWCRADFPVGWRHMPSSPFYADELLDWDFAVEGTPKPARTMKVILKYVPRGKSAPFEDPAD